MPPPRLAEPARYVQTLVTLPAPKRLIPSILEKTMKPVLRTVGIGAALVAAIGLLAAVTYDQPLAVLLWPGFLVMNYVFSVLGFDGIAFTNFGWLFWPALLIDVVLYGLLYLVFRKAVAWKRKQVVAGPKI